MSYYAAGTRARYQDNQPQAAEAAQEEYYNPYNPSGHQYTDEPQASGYNNYPPPQREPTSSSRRSKPSMSVTPVRRESSGFEQGEFTPGEITSQGPKWVHLNVYLPTLSFLNFFLSETALLRH